MPQAKPVSLYPLTFHEALKALIKADPDRVGAALKQRRNKSSSKTRKNRQELQHG
jgi:hypothetical protein